MEYLDPTYALKYARINHKDALAKKVQLGIITSILSGCLAIFAPVLLTVSVFGLWIAYTPNILLFIARRHK